MAASLDVLAYIIYIIKEVAEGIEQEIGLAWILDDIGIGEDADALMLDVHIDFGTCHDGIAVVVDGALLFAVALSCLSVSCMLVSCLRNRGSVTYLSISPLHITFRLPRLHSSSPVFMAWYG